MDTSSNVPCFTGVLVLRRDDTVTNNDGIHEIEELLRVTVQGESVPNATDIAPFTFVESDRTSLDHSWFRSFVLTNETNKKLYGSSLTWTIRTVTDDIDEESTDQDGDSSDDSSSDYSDRSTPPPSSSSTIEPRIGPSIHLAIILIGKLSSFFTYNRILRLLADTMEDGGDDPTYRLIRLRLASEALLSHTPYPLPGTSLKINFATLSSVPQPSINTPASSSSSSSSSLPLPYDDSTIVAPPSPPNVSKSIVSMAPSLTPSLSSSPTLDAIVSVPYLHHHPTTIELESLYSLFRLLPVPVIISIFRCLLLETRIIIHIEEASIGLLAPLCESLLSLLYPFVWSHTYAPLLPVGLEVTTLLDSPCPFFIGTSTETINSIPLSTFMDTNTVVIDVDNGRIHVPNETVVGTPLPTVTGSLFSRAPWFSPSSSLSGSRRLGGKSTGTFFPYGSSTGTKDSSSANTLPAFPARLQKQLTLSLQQFTKNCYNPVQCKTEFKNLSNNHNGKEGTLPIGRYTLPSVMEPTTKEEKLLYYTMDSTQDQYSCGTYSPVQRIFTESLLNKTNDNVSLNNAPTNSSISFNHLGIQRAFLDIMLAFVGDYDDHMKEINDVLITNENQTAEGIVSSSIQAAAYLGLTFDKVSSLQGKNEYEPFISVLYGTQAFDNFLTARLNLTAWTDLSVLYFDAIIDTLVTGKPSAFLQDYNGTYDKDQPCTVSKDTLFINSFPPLSQFSAESTFPLLNITCAIPSVTMIAENKDNEYSDIAYSIVPTPPDYAYLYDQTYTYLQTQLAMTLSSSQINLRSPVSTVLSPLPKSSTPSAKELISPLRNTIVSPTLYHQATESTEGKDRLRTHRLSSMHQQLNEEEKGKNSMVSKATHGTRVNDKRGWFARMFSTDSSITTTTTSTGITTTSIRLVSPNPPVLKSPFGKLQSPRTVMTTNTMMSLTSPQGLIGSPSGGKRNILHQVNVPSSSSLSTVNSGTQTHRKYVHSSSSSTANVFLSPLPAVSTVTPAFASPLFHGRSMTVKSRRRKMLVEQNPELANIVQNSSSSDSTKHRNDTDETSVTNNRQRNRDNIEEMTGNEIAENLLSPNKVTELPTLSFQSFVVAEGSTADTAGSSGSSSGDATRTITDNSSLLEQYHPEQLYMLQKALNQALVTIEQLRTQPTNNEDSLIEIAIVPTVNWRYEEIFERIKLNAAKNCKVKDDTDNSNSTISTSSLGNEGNELVIPNSTVTSQEILRCQQQLTDVHRELEKMNTETSSTSGTSSLRIEPILSRLTNLENELLYYTRLFTVQSNEEKALRRIENEYRRRNYDEDYLRRGIQVVCSYYAYQKEITVPPKPVDRAATVPIKINLGIENRVFG